MKKIMFNDRYGLTQAVLNGCKTQTRRIIQIGLRNQTDWKAIREGDYEAVVDGEGYYHDIRRCGQYQIGEELAVAQRYANDDVLTFNAYDDEGQPRKDGYKRHQEMLASEGYRNKMFVRAEYMPHRIRITDIKVERLQDINEMDILREGVYYYNCGIDNGYTTKGLGYNFSTAHDAFACLIDKVNGAGTWQKNPWVFAYTFELVR